MTVTPILTRFTNFPTFSNAQEKKTPASPLNLNQSYSDKFTLRFGSKSDEPEIPLHILTPNDDLDPITKMIWGIKLNRLNGHRQLWGWMPPDFYTRGAQEHIEEMKNTIGQEQAIFAIAQNPADRAQVVASSGVGPLLEDRLKLLESDQPPTGGFKPEEFLNLVTKYAKRISKLSVNPDHIKALYSEGQIGELQYVYVHDDFKGNSLARRLTGKVLEENRTKDKRFPIIVLQVQDDHAHSIYESLGFQDMISRKPNYNGTHSTYMIKVEPELLKEYIRNF